MRSHLKVVNESTYNNHIRAILSYARWCIWNKLFQITNELQKINNIRSELKQGKKTISSFTYLL